MSNKRGTRKTTLAVIKPEAISRRLVGEILKRFEEKGLLVIYIRSLRVDERKAAQQYGSDLARRHGPEVRTWAIRHIVGRQVILVLLEGNRAVRTARAIVGTSADPEKCNTGTIRRDLSDDTLSRAVQEQRAVQNLVHAPRNSVEVRREMAIWRHTLEVE